MTGSTVALHRKWENPAPARSLTGAITSCPSLADIALCDGDRCAKVSAMNTGDFNIDQQVNEEGICVVTVRGELDVHTAPQLSEALTVAGGSGSAVIVDCSGVPFMDSTGLSVFVAARNRMDEVGSSLGIVVTEPAVRKVFTITGLDSVMAIHESLEAALKAA